MKKIFKVFKLLLTTLLTASLLCTSVSSSSFSYSNVIENPETFNFDSDEFIASNYSPSSFSDDDVRLIQKILENPDLAKNAYQDVIDDSVADDISLPPAVTNASTQVSSSSDTVARLQIFAWAGDEGSGSSSLNFGHAFLVITNVSDHNIYAGALSIKPNTGLTIGTWDTFANEHRGLWYCLEGYHYYHKHEYSGSYSMAVMLNQSLLDKANEVIRNNDSWSPLNNCSTFATKVWNTVCSTKLNAGSPINTPKGLRDCIASFPSNYYGIDAEIPVYYAAYYGEPPTKSKNVI